MRDFSSFEIPKRFLVLCENEDLKKYFAIRDEPDISLATWAMRYIGKFLRNNSVPVINVRLTHDTETGMGLYSCDLEELKMRVDL